MEVVVYHTYNSSLNNPLPAQGSRVVKLAKIFAFIGVGLILFSVFPKVTGFVKENINSSVAALKLTNTEVNTLSATNQEKITYTPRFDPTLPFESRLKISAIGVDTELEESTYDNYEEALKKGVWRVSDFGTPTDNERPIILAAHRFGYLAWDNLFRRKNSFYNLPKLKVGDTVVIIWRQRKYVYEIYAQEKGEEITDYSADLILYTCETLNGPVRIFKYAKLLEV